MTASTVAPVPTPSSAALVPADARERTRAYQRDARAENTRRAYRASLRVYLDWCRDALGVEPREALAGDPEVVSAFLAEEAARGLSPATVSLRASAIAHAHRTAGLPNPCDGAEVAETLRGIRRAHAKAGGRPKRADALTVERLAAALARVPLDTLPGKRDAALLALGFALGARRSELVALDVADVVDDGEGLAVVIRRAKTDQAGEGAELYVPEAGNPQVCAVRAVRAWLEAAALTDGALFRDVIGRGQGARVLARLSDRSVDNVVKRHARAAGLTGRYSAHSLRAGLVTTLAERGRTEVEIMRQSRHRTSAMVKVYTRSLDAKRDTPLRGAY